MIGIFYGLVFMNLLFVTSTVCLMKPSKASVVATACAGVAWLFFVGAGRQNQTSDEASEREYRRIVEEDWERAVARLLDEEGY